MSGNFAVSPDALLARVNAPAREPGGTPSTGSGHSRDDGLRRNAAAARQRPTMFDPPVMGPAQRDRPLIEEIMDVELPKPGQITPGALQDARGRPAPNNDDSSEDRSPIAQMSLAALGGAGLSKTILDQARIGASLPYAVKHDLTGNWRTGFFTNTAQSHLDPYAGPMLQEGKAPANGGGVLSRAWRGLGTVGLLGAGAAVSVPKLQSAIEQDGLKGLVTTDDGRNGLAFMGVTGAGAMALSRAGTFGKAYGLSNVLGGGMALTSLGVGLPNLATAISRDGVDGLWNTKDGRTGVLQTGTGMLTTGLLGTAAMRGYRNGVTGAGAMNMEPGLKAAKFNMFHDPIIQKRMFGMIGLGTAGLTIANELGYFDSKERRQDLGVIGAGAGTAFMGARALLKRETPAAVAAKNAGWEHLYKQEYGKAFTTWGKRAGISAKAGAIGTFNAARSGASALANPSTLPSLAKSATPSLSTISRVAMSKPGIGALGVGALGVANHFGAFDFLDS